MGKIMGTLLVAIVLLLGRAYASRNQAQAPGKFKVIALAAMAQYNCVNCHTIDGAPRNRNMISAPRLNQIALRRSKDWIMQWMENPPAIKPGAIMPIFPLSKEQQEAIAEYLISLSTPVDSKAIFKQAKTQEEAGEKFIAVYDCLACHSIKAEGLASMGRRVGPDLSHIASEITVTGEQWSEAWEAAWLYDPAAKKPGTFMPKFTLTDKEIKAIVAYIKTLR